MIPAGASQEAPLLVIVGPTGSGKSDLACRLAELTRGEVIGADSVQVYRHFDIGSAKPSPEERRRVVHHLIDIVEPDEALEAAQWAARAQALLDQLRDRGVRPILCGGSFLWIRALLYGLASAPPAHPDLRAQHARIAQELGRPALHERLSRVDPDSAARLHPNDFVRVSRALEVHELTGTPLSALQAQHGFRHLRYPARLIGIRLSPQELDERLARRCHEMFETGWVDEVRRLLASGYGATRPMGAVGYRNISRALGQNPTIGPQSRRDLEQEVFRATRVFARRQRTWLRSQPVRWIEPGQLVNSRDLRQLLAE